MNVGLWKTGTLIFRKRGFLEESEHQSFIEREGSWKNRNTNLSKARDGSYDLLKGVLTIFYKHRQAHGYWTCGKTPYYTMHRVIGKTLIVSLTKKTSKKSEKQNQKRIWCALSRSKIKLWGCSTNLQTIQQQRPSTWSITRSQVILTLRLLAVGTTSSAEWRAKSCMYVGNRAFMSKSTRTSLPNRQGIILLRTNCKVTGAS